MKPRLDLLTVAVADVPQAHQFYIDGLGWTPALYVPGDILFVQVNAGLLLGFFGARDLAVDIGVPQADVVVGSGFTLAHNVDTPDDVRAVMDAARAAGATILKEAQQAEWGGYHGYFADPSGIRWEVAHNPGWQVDENGKVTLGPVT